CGEKTGTMLGRVRHQTSQDLGLERIGSIGADRDTAVDMVEPPGEHGVVDDDLAVDTIEVKPCDRPQPSLSESLVEAVGDLFDDGPETTRRFLVPARSGHLERR